MGEKNTQKKIDEQKAEEQEKVQDIEKLTKEDSESAEKQTENILAEYINQLQRIQAEFENYKKRIEREKKELVDYGKVLLITKLLNVYDDFERMIAVMDTAEKEDIKTGVQMIFKQLQKIFEEEGVKPIQAVGLRLDPFKHEVLIRENGEQDDIVLKELQKGYMFKDKVLRTAKVVLSKKLNQNEQIQNKETNNKGVEK